MNTSSASFGIVHIPESFWLSNAPKADHIWSIPAVPIVCPNLDFTEVTGILFVKEAFVDVLEDVAEVARHALTELFRVFDVGEVFVCEQFVD